MRSEERLQMMMQLRRQQRQMLPVAAVPLQRAELQRTRTRTRRRRILHFLSGHGWRGARPELTAQEIARQPQTRLGWELLQRLPPRWPGQVPAAQPQGQCAPWCRARGRSATAAQMQTQTQTQ